MNVLGFACRFPKFWISHWENNTSSANPDFETREAPKMRSARVPVRSGARGEVDPSNWD